MSLWVIAGGVLAGLGIFLVVREVVPASARLDAALGRMDATAAPEQQTAWQQTAGLQTAGQQRPGQQTAGRQRAGRQPAGRHTAWPRRAGPPAWASGDLAHRIAAELPWLPVPAADLALLGQSRESWVASKVICGLLGLACPAALASLAALTGSAVSLAIPAGASLACGAALFFAPDLVTKVNAAQKRADFRHALTSYLDLVSLERGAGAGPTEALEAAAEIGQGWPFERIAAALDQARRSGSAPWTALAGLAAETGIIELSDIADIAEVAGQEGARILDTLAARAASMRAQALAADRAKAGSRSTTMVVPIALLAVGFLVLLVFPIFYGTFGAG